MVVAKLIEGGASLRILLYTREFPPYTGGAGTYVYELASGLHALSTELWVLAPRYGSSDDETDAGVPFPVVRVPVSGEEVPMRPSRKASRLIRAELSILGRTIRDNRIDVVLVCDKNSQRCAARLDW